jgi:DNA-binding XRE family transcriptional regulator
VHQGEAMIFKRSPLRSAKRWNGQRRAVPVEPLSARVLRLRIARGYSADELAAEAGVTAGTIRLLEAGKPADKRVLAPLAAALGVPLCRLVCGDHNCSERACVPGHSAPVPQKPPC